jgi:hypothetical protein
VRGVVRLRAVFATPVRAERPELSVLHGPDEHQSDLPAVAQRRHPKDRRRLPMKSLLALVFVAALACSHVPPVVAPLSECGGKLVTQANIVRIEQDLENLGGGGDADLLAFAESEGWDFVVCMVDWYLANGTAPQKSGAQRFKMGHVEARGRS